MNRNEIEDFISREKKEVRSSYQLKTYTGKDFTTEENGSISGYFATFDHDHGDSYGDVIKKGAFAGTIAKRKKNGHPFPMCFNHDFNSIIGRVTDIGEDNKGAYFTAEFFPTEKAQDIRNMVKSGVLWQFSFAYDVLSSGKVTAGDGSTVRELRELELYEISIVVVPANPRATITDIKKTFTEKKQELLRYIEEMEAIPMESKRELQKKIYAMMKESALRKLKEKESQALKDIQEAEAKGNISWRNSRLQAIVAIRKQIADIKNLP
ncbi:MAG: HK97 family phage prohead protease [Parasporobacterium sp.]|nr:HK97 family phage prohead protease [Parasporobacterium sp.]